jgi:hypothetical protein
MVEFADSDLRKAKFRRSFAARRRRQLYVVTPFLVLIVAVAALADEHTQAVLGVSPRVWVPPLFAALAGAAVYSFFNWRCPACNKYLGKQWNPLFCSKCGVPLR